MKGIKLSFILIIVLIVVFAFCGCEGREDALVESFSTKAPTKYIPSGLQVDGQYIILGISTETGEMIVRHIDSSRQFLYTFNLSTTFYDKFGGYCSVTQFMPGKIIEIDSVNRDGVIGSTRISKDVWEYDDIKNYKIDAERGVFTIGTTNYQITEFTSIFAGGNESTIASIGANDTLRVIGSDKKIWSISITTGHGYISFENTQTFNGSLICIGDIYTLISGDMIVEVPEGIYTVTAANNGYGGSVEIAVNRDETVSLNMEEIKGEGPKVCIITFRVPVEGARIYIDGRLVDATVPLPVAYGKHQLAVSAAGYEDWNKTLFVNSPQAEISLELSAEDKKNNTNNNTNTNTNTNNNTNNNSSGNNTGNNTNNNANTNTNNNTNNNSNSSTNNDSNQEEKNKTELEYLTTISDMLSILMGGRKE